MRKLNWLLTGAVVSVMAGAAMVAAPAFGRQATTTPTTPAKPAETKGGAFQIDSVHSNAVFRVSHMGVSNFYGMISAPEGSYHFDAANPSASSCEVTFKLANLDTGNEKRDGHLRNPDFFNAEKFPTITFKSTSITKTGDKKMKVMGDMTMLGKTAPVMAEVEMIGEKETPQGYKSGFDAIFTIKRSDFGMTKYVEGGMLGDEVKVWVGIEGARK